MTFDGKKHILFLTSWYPSRIPLLLDDGDFVQRHAKAVSLLNHVTSLHAIKDSNLKQNFELFEQKENGFNEVTVYFSPSWFRPWNFIKKQQAYLIGLRHIGNFDLVHLNITYPAGIIALYLKWFRKKKYVISENWTGFRTAAFDKESFIKRFVIKTILENANKLLPVSNDLKKSMTRIAPNAESVIIPNVVATNLFVPKKGHKMPKNRIRFLHASSLKDDHKNISGMLRVALKLIRDGYDFEFKIGGNGDTTPIQHFIDEHKMGDYISTFGRLTHAEVAEKMQNADCFILFSNRENQPCVQIESFASGIAVIATKVGGIAEFFPEDFGFLMERGDENALYDAMKKTIGGATFASPETMNKYAIQHFSEDEIAKQFDEVYNQVLA